MCKYIKWAGLLWKNRNRFGFLLHTDLRSVPFMIIPVYKYIALELDENPVMNIIRYNDNKSTLLNSNISLLS